MNIFCSKVSMFHRFAVSYLAFARTIICKKSSEFQCFIAYIQHQSSTSFSGSSSGGAVKLIARLFDITVPPSSCSNCSLATFAT